MVEMSRRDFLRLAVLASAGVVLSGLWFDAYSFLQQTKEGKKGSEEERREKVGLTQMERFAEELKKGMYIPIWIFSLNLPEKPTKMEGGWELSVLSIEGKYLSRDSNGPSWSSLKGSLALYADSKYMDISKRLLEDPKSDVYLILYPLHSSINEILLTTANGEQVVHVPYISVVAAYQDRKKLFQRILEGETRITAREEAKPYHYELQGVENVFPSEEEYRKFINGGKELGKTVNGNLVPQLVFTDDGVVAIYVTPRLPDEDWKSINEFFNSYQKKD